MNRYTVVPIKHHPTGVVINCGMEPNSKGEWVPHNYTQALYDALHNIVNEHPEVLPELVIDHCKGLLNEK